MATIRTFKGKRGTTYQAIVRRKGYSPQSQTFDNAQDAQDWADKLELGIRDRTVDPAKLGKKNRLNSAIDVYLKKKIKGSKNERDTTRLLRWWELKMGLVFLAELNAVNIDEQLDNLHASGSTKNRYLGALSGCLTFISKGKYGWIVGNPCRDVERHEEGKARQRVLTKAEVQKLFAYADKLATKATAAAEREGTGKRPRWQERQLPTFLRLAYATGRRRNELLKLRWIDVDLENGSLYLDDTKTGDDQMSYIDADMIAVLKKHEQEFKVEGVPYIFRGRFPNKPTDFDAVTREALKALFKPDRKGEVPVLHSIRHTVATEMGSGGATEAQIMAVTGHKSSASVNRYVKKTEEAARAAQAKRKT